MNKNKINPTPAGHNDPPKPGSAVKKRDAVIIVSVLIVAAAGFFYYFSTRQPARNVPSISKADTIPTAETSFDSQYFNEAHFNIDRVTNPVERSFIEYGKKLVDETAQYIGPEVKNPALRFSGNNLSCDNCHLNSGTRPFAMPFIGVWGTYPNFRGRDNMLGTLEDRINGCMERSMNGKPLPVDGKEMKAMLAYIEFVNKGVPIGEKIKGQGLESMHFPDRAASPEQGSIIFAQYCRSCHGENGQGLRNGEPGDGKGYLYPPLWGGDSFNDGAGMHRLLTAARFIKANMPYGVAVGKPTLTDDEAYDVAAYINSFPRPEKAHKEKDYPDLKLKPQDCPYPPYADTMSIEQHKLGPYVFNQK